ncbi:MAG: hypothetical protein ACO3C1_04360 [Ilumatobacteraceae bacterium]
MESLALLATIILLGTLAAGIVSIVAIVRRPRRFATRVVVAACGAVAVAAGVNVARLDIALGTRLFGIVVAGLGGAAVGTVVGRQSPRPPQ